jgi:sugar lactone lactonase YvrE
MLRVVSLAAAVIAAAALAGGSSAGKSAFPEVIQLPAGFQPEGIEVGRGTTFYVGSRVTGAIYRGNLRTGVGATLPRDAAGGAGRTATGIELDRRNRLWVAGARTGDAYLFNARTGAILRTYDFAGGDTFINDVVVTRSAAYFTDSRKAVFYVVPIGPGGALGSFRTLPLTGADFALPDFNLNGIDATRNGKTLIAVQSNTGKLFRIDAATGAAREITLAGGESVPNGDGILLTGKMLYVVQNQNNRVAVISLAANLASGSVVTRLFDSDFSVPTTIDDLGRRLYAVNARFGVANPGTAAYQVVQLAKPRLR